MMTESKRAALILLEDEEVIELARILMDDGAEAALAFLKRHLKGKDSLTRRGHQARTLKSWPSSAKCAIPLR